MQIKVAKYIAQYLVQYGISQMFTVTGGGAMHLNDAFGHQEGLACVYNHHEQACAIAAESYARLTRKIAAVCVTSGPGGTNAITGALGGWLDSIPMLIISGQVKFSTTIKSTDVPLRQLGDQEFNITDCVACMTKYAVMVTEPNDIAYHLEKALYLAEHGRPGPCWLDIPLNVQGAVIDTENLRHFDEKELEKDYMPADSAIAFLLEKVKSSKRPVILAGTGVRVGKAENEFLRAIDKLQIPVLTAWNAHDLLWDTHPLYCGRPGTVGTRGGNIILQSADLLISFACRMNIRMISYNWENFGKNAYKIAIDIDENELKKPTVHIDYPIHADILPTLSKIADSDYVANGRHAAWLSHCRAIDARYPAARREFYQDESPLNPYVFFKALSQKLHEGDVTVCGNGSACVCSFQAMEIKPYQRLYTNSGCASMGYGLPAALGAATALSGQRVICLDGDGSIQMNLQELQTIVHNQLNVKIFWLNNNGYHSIRQTQTNLFNKNFCGISKENGVSFPEAEKIAFAYGFPFLRADSLSTLGSVLDDVLSSPSYAICEVVLSDTQFFEPKLSARSLPDGTMVSPSLEDMYPFLPQEELKEAMQFGE